MLALLPNEHWDYGVLDLARGLAAALAATRRDVPPPIVVPGVGPSLPVRSGRAAIVLALQALELPDGAAVGVPLYCCPVVFKAVHAAGCRLRFIDVEPATYCMSAADLAAKSRGLDAVIAVHMFGNTSDVPVLRQAAPGRPFIEDCAQGLGCRLNGREAGDLGDIGVFSFRSGKYLSVGEGAAVHSRNETLHAKLQALIARLPIPGRMQECGHVARTYLRTRLHTRPLWGLVGTRVWEEYGRRVPYTSQSPLVIGRAFEADCTLTVRRMAALESWIEKQRSNADYYLSHLAVPADVLCQEPSGAFFNRLQFPLLLRSPEQCELMVRSLRADGISTARPYKDIATVAADHYGYAGDCPQAERVARTVMVIPCHHALSQAQVERVAACVNRAWSRIGGLSS